VWGLEVFGDGTDRFGIADHSAGQWRLLIDINGRFTFTSQNDPWPMQVNTNNQWALIQTNTTQRAWSCGGDSGHWVVRDESANGAVRFRVNNNGNTEIMNDLWMVNRTSVYNVWDLFTYQLYISSPGDYNRKITNVDGHFYFDGGAAGGTGIKTGGPGIEYSRHGPGFWSFVYNQGYLAVILNNTFWFNISPASSDERLKSNIVASEIDALGLINQLEMIEFDKSDGSPMGGPSKHFKVGVRGQQIEQIMPDTVMKGPVDAPIPGQIQIDVLALNGYMLKAIQQLTQRLEALEGGV
jgi:hypothetical protein